MGKAWLLFGGISIFYLMLMFITAIFFAAINNRGFEPLGIFLYFLPLIGIPVHLILSLGTYLIVSQILGWEVIPIFTLIIISIIIPICCLLGPILLMYASTRIQNYSIRQQYTDLSVRNSNTSIEVERLGNESITKTSGYYADLKVYLDLQFSEVPTGPMDIRVKIVNSSGKSIATLHQNDLKILSQRTRIVLTDAIGTSNLFCATTINSSAFNVEISILPDPRSSYGPETFTEKLSQASQNELINLGKELRSDLRLGLIEQPSCN